MKSYRQHFGQPPYFDKNLIAKFWRADSMMEAQKLASDFARGAPYSLTEEKENDEHERTSGKA